MFSFLLSLVATFMAPAGLATPPAPAPAAAEPAAPLPAESPGLAWLDGTWRSGGLEMVCAARGAAADCREEGKSGPMQGAVAELKFAASGAAPQLILTLPSIPSSIFVEVAREAQSATYEMKTPNGVARLRFTRTGDELKVERGNATGWGQVLVDRRG